MATKNATQPVYFRLRCKITNNNSGVLTFSLALYEIRFWLYEMLKRSEFRTRSVFYSQMMKLTFGYTCGDHWPPTAACPSVVRRKWMAELPTR